MQHAHESEDLPARRMPPGVRRSEAARDGRRHQPAAASSGRWRPLRILTTTRGDDMRVRKRNGDLEAVDVNKIVRAVERWVADLDEVDPLRVATRTISGLYDGATTAELDKLSIRTAAELIGEEPQYSRLAARLLAAYVDKEVRGQGIASFSQSLRYGHELGLIGDATAKFVARNAR